MNYKTQTKAHEAMLEAFEDLEFAIMSHEKTIRNLARKEYSYDTHSLFKRVAGLQLMLDELRAKVEKVTDEYQANAESFAQQRLLAAIFDPTERISHLETLHEAYKQGTPYNEAVDALLSEESEK
jgi:hypothetical protein